MRTTLCILSIFISGLAWSQSNERYIQLTSSEHESASIVWLSTKVEKHNKVVLKAKLFASFPIDKSHVYTLINDKKEGAKAEISTLFGNAEYEYTYERTLNLPHQKNNFQIVLEGPKEKYLSSVLEIKEKKVRILSDDDFSTRVLWVFPDPAKTEGRRTRLENSLLHYKIVVKTGILLGNKGSILVHLNDRIYAPKDSDVLRKIGDDMYEFQGSILLNQNIEINELYISVDINDSEIRSKSYLITVDEEKPSLYLLSIGTHTNLDYTAKDAQDFADIFKDQDHEDGLFQNITIETLTGYDAETQPMRIKIEEMGARMGAGIIHPKDLVILFISSHGFLEDNQLRIQGDDYDPSARIATSISFEYDVINILKKMDCKKLIFVDACHSGGGAKYNIADINYEIERLNQVQKGISTIVSSQKDEQSWEDRKWQNGAFTEAIIAALKGGRADRDGNQLITINELYDFLKVEVPAMVYRTKQKRQTPILLSDELGDVAIYFVY